MKYSKYILVVLAVLVVGFFLLGIIKPTLAYECEIEVEKSAEESWAVIEDEEKLAEWLPGFQKIELVSGTPGTVGAVSNVYFENDGQQMKVQETITEVIPNESMSMIFEDDFMTMDYKISLSSADGKTKISSNTTALGNGMMSKSIMALMGSMFDEQEQANLEKLKIAIEQNTKDYFPQEEEVVENDEIEE